MQCRLCLEDKDLRKESSIIPNSMYSQVKGEEGYYRKLKGNTLKEYRSGKTLKEFRTGEYESDILCAECENDILNKRYEDYSLKVLQVIKGRLKSFKDIEIEQYKNKRDMTGKRIKNIDYSKFKLFLLSILWRASIAKRGLWTQVKLGKKHEEIIRKMLLEQDPKEPEDYPCFIADMSIDEPELKGWILQPKRVKVEGNISYEFMISGMQYWFTISKFARKDIAHAGIINKDNSMIIWKAPDNMGKYYFSKSMNYIKQRLEKE